MKTMTAYANYAPVRRSVAYPNAATRRQALHKLLDTLLLGACGAGIGAMVLLMMVLL